MRNSIVIVSILRIVCLPTVTFTDPTYTMAMGLFWTSLEPCLCVINANLPMVRTIFVDFSPRVFGPAGGRSSRIPETSGWGGRGISLFASTRDGGDIERGRNEAATESHKSTLTISRSADCTPEGMPEPGRQRLPDAG